jgi:hypothetical protein
VNETLPVGRVIACGSQTTGEPRWLPEGPLVEVLVLDDVPLDALPTGTRLRLGPEAVVEILAPVAAGSAGLVAALQEGRTGARVVAGGPVGPGDPVAIEAVVLPTEDVLDLHAFHPADTAAVVEEYLAAARAAGLREVRIVHGRGKGVQRALVRRLLAGSAHVSAFGEAPGERGGWGATVVRLRPEDAAR